MVPSSLVQLLRGPFNFLRRDEEEIRQLLPDAERILPLPQKVFLEDESSTPLTGFPFLLTEDLAALDQALETYLIQEEEVQIAILSHQTFDRALYANAWERYRNLLARATENVTTSSYGRHYPGIFWLYHSLAVARALKETPKRILRRDLTIGRVHGDEIKYRVFYKYLDRVLALTYDLVNRLALDTEEIEEELFPALMTRMRDNVLIFTEDHISPNLAELGSYFSGYLHIDGRDLRGRLSALAAWNAEQLRLDADLRAAVALLGATGENEPRELLNRTGYLTFLTSRPGYSREI